MLRATKHILCVKWPLLLALIFVPNNNNEGNKTSWVKTISLFSDTILQNEDEMNAADICK